MPEPGPPPSSEEATPAAPAEAPRFCTLCGAALTPGAACACAALPAPQHPIIPLARGPGLRTALRLYFALLAVSIILTIALLAIPEEHDTAALRAALDIAATIVWATVTLAACFTARRSLRPVLARAGPAWCFAAAIPAAALTFLLATFLTGAVARWMQLEEQSYIADYVEAGYGPWMPLLIIAVCPGIFEELAFRGVITASLSSLLERREVLIVTALLFAILHLSPVSIPHLFIIGLALGLLRNVSGSLYPGMVLHFCHNALVVASEYKPEFFP